MGFSKKSNRSSLLLIAICLLTAHPALSQTRYYAGKTITIIRGGGPGGSGEFQSRALMPYLKKVHTGQPQHHDGVHGRRLREKGGELLLYGETRWAQDRLRRREPTPLSGEEVEKAVRELPRDAEVIALYKKLADGGPLPSR
jgi:hypothetical protein